MAQVPAGKTRKGKNFSAEEERSLCRSFLAVSQDPICGNGQRNFAFWERITAHFNQSKPRSNPVRPSRSLETKWGNIKHDVGKFCGAYKQVFDCRESGTSLDDVVEKSLQFYQDRHPKQQPFAYLHCWQVLKDVPRWWDSPSDVQRRSIALESSPKGVGMPKRKSPPAIASEVATEVAASGSASEEDVALISPTGFPPRPTRPQGTKAAKADFVAQKKREKILQSQARATETMAEASLRKANALQDQCAMSLFTMPLEEGMTEEARRYFTLRRQEEIQRLERRMQVERRQAELDELEHARLVKERNQEPPLARNRPVAPAVVPAPSSPPPAPAPSAPSAVFAGDQDDSSWEGTECIPDTPATVGESQADQSLGGSQDPRVVGPSQGRIFRTGLSVEMPHPDYVCSAPSAFGNTNVMYGVSSPMQGAFTENQMLGYRNGGPGLNLNAQFY